MKSILTISVFIVLFTSFAQKDSIGEALPIPKPLKTPEIDSVPEKIQEINKRYETILERDEIIEKKIAEIIEKSNQINSDLSAKNKKLAGKIEAKEKEVEIHSNKIDSLNNVIEKYESSLVLVDSICTRWSFLTKRINENCREWKIILIKQ